MGGSTKTTVPVRLEELLFCFSFLLAIVVSHDALLSSLRSLKETSLVLFICTLSCNMLTILTYKQFHISRKRLFQMINDLPTVFEVVTGNVKSAKETAANNNNSSKSKNSSKIVRSCFKELAFYIFD